MIGLAQKAGKVASGEFQQRRLLKPERHTQLLLQMILQIILRKCLQICVLITRFRYIFFSDKVSVGHAIGKEFRASLAVLDEGFAKTIEKYFEQGLE